MNIQKNFFKEKDLKGEIIMGKALHIAKYIIDKCFKDNSPITNLRLQKILYFVQLEAYSKCKRPAFEEDIEAWQFGPVVPIVYYEYCNYVGMPILEYYNVTDDIDVEIKNAIDDVISKYAKFTVWDLVNLTHAEGTPWKETYVSYEKRVIPKNLIEKESIKQ